jgi:hypothetical protein
MQAAEKKVEALVSELAKLDRTLADPELYASADKAQKIVLERGQLAKRLSDSEALWLEATEAYEAVASVETEQA